MPTLSMFYGIIIRMFDESGGQHNLPHFHAAYQGKQATFDFNGNILAGKFPNKQKQLIKAWVILHREELEANWELIKEDSDYFKIEPLR
ncbi:MAG: DUF4160 domain-containing protein [Ruminococcus sp.]|nr:DUF4160 domain-containing protein [Ruminococcus sp.]